MGVALLSHFLWVVFKMVHEVENWQMKVNICEHLAITKLQQCERRILNFHNDIATEAIVYLTIAEA